MARDRLPPTNCWWQLLAFREYWLCTDGSWQLVNGHGLQHDWYIYIYIHSLLRRTDKRYLTVRLDGAIGLGTAMGLNQATGLGMVMVMGWGVVLAMSWGVVMAMGRGVVMAMSWGVVMAMGRGVATDLDMATALGLGVALAAVEMKGSWPSESDQGPLHMQQTARGLGSCFGVAWAIWKD